MKKGEESRQRLIECSAELFWKNGYSATGISEILKQTGLPKGSFYFYFKSKDDLAAFPALSQWGKAKGQHPAKSAVLSFFSTPRANLARGQYCQFS